MVFEEFGSGAAALHLKDEIERNELLRDESYRRWFRKDYDNKWGPRAWHRDFDAEIVACPDESLLGKTFGDVGVERGGLHQDAAQARADGRPADGLLRGRRAPAATSRSITAGSDCCATSAMRSDPASRS